MATVELGKICALEGKNIMLVGNEENNLGRKKEAYKSLGVLCSSKRMASFSKLGTLFIFSIIITCVSAGVAWPSTSQD